MSQKHDLGDYFSQTERKLFILKKVQNCSSKKKVLSKKIIETDQVVLAASVPENTFWVIDLQTVVQR